MLVTYDEFGGYGHPDRIQAHRVATYAAALAAVPSYRKDLGEPWEISKIYWGAMSESRFRASMRALRDAGDETTFEGLDPDGPLAVDDPDQGTWTPSSTRSLRGATFAAMKAHATQITVDGPFFLFALSNNLGNQVWGEKFSGSPRGTTVLGIDLGARSRARPWPRCGRAWPARPSASRRRCRCGWASGSRRSSRPTWGWPSTWTPRWRRPRRAAVARSAGSSARTAWRRS